MTNTSENLEVIIILLKLKFNILMVIFIVTIINVIVERHYQKYIIKKRLKDRFKLRMRNLRLIRMDDRTYIEQLIMDMHIYWILCSLLCSMGHLHDITKMCVEEQTVMLFHIFVYHTKNRIVKFQFMHSRETISRHFNIVLNAILRLEKIIFKKPESIPENCTDERWKSFKVHNFNFISLFFLFKF